MAGIPDASFPKRALLARYGIDSWQVLWTPEQDQFTTKETK